MVYSYHDYRDKTKLWKELSDMKSNVDVPLLILGDFNEIRNRKRGKAV